MCGLKAVTGHPAGPDPESLLIRAETEAEQEALIAFVESLASEKQILLMAEIRAGVEVAEALRRLDLPWSVYNSLISKGKRAAKRILGQGVE